jgi:PAS domain S-box-containing protein
MIRILHADDIKDDFEITRFQLLRVTKEIELTWAETSKGALKLLAGEEFDCILSDFQMPDMTGLELLQSLRNNGIDTPFIFLTGQGNEELAAEALRAGADDYFTKEVGFAHYSRLHHSILRVVQVHAERRAKRAAEQALKESEETYRNLIELARDAIAIAQNLRFVFVNPQFTNLTGYSSEEALAHGLEKFIAPEEYPKVRDYHLRRTAGEDVPKVYETVMLHKDGSSKPIEVNATSISYKGGSATLAIIRDISERKHAERLVAKELELLRSILDGGPMPIIVANLDRKVIVWNKSAEALTGIRSEQVLDKPLDPTIFYPEAGKTRPLLMDIALSGDRTLFEKYYGAKEIRTSSFSDRVFQVVDELMVGGKKRLLSFMAAPVNEGSGKLIGAVEVFQDLTETRKIESDLDEAEARLRQIISNVNDIIYTHDLEGNFTSVSPSATRLYKYSAAEILGMNIADVVDPAYLPIALRELDLHKRNIDYKSVFELLTRDRDGREIWVEVSTKLVKHNGMEAEILGIARDITDRKRSEDILEKQRAAIDAAMDGMALLDEREKYIYLNQAHADVYGYRNPGELLGKTWRVLYTDDSIERFQREIMPQLYRDGHWRGEAIGKKKDGSLFPQEISLSVVSNGGIVCICRDITDCKKAVSELKESEQWLRTVFEGSRDAVFISDDQARFVDVNEAASVLTGYSRSELKNMSIPDLHDEEDLGAYRDYFERIMNGEAVLSAEKLRRKDGSKVDVEFSNSMITIGGASYMHTTARDVSDRVRMEEDMLRHSDTLARYAHHLEALNQELEAFGYTVSHDLQAPLRHILGFSQALMEDYAEKLGNKGREYLERVVVSTNKMGQLINDLLRLSRSSRGDFHLEEVNLSGMAHSIADNLIGSEGGRKVSFTITDGLFAAADKRFIRIVLQNLIDNAWKFTGRKREARIEFGREERDGCSCFFVRDNGVGFDPRKANLLFVPFQRLHSAEEFPGTGIGLATVQRIIHRHGGRVWAEAKPGKGAAFYFTLNEFGGNQAPNRS